LIRSVQTCSGRHNDVDKTYLNLNKVYPNLFYISFLNQEISLRLYVNVQHFVLGTFTLNILRILRLRQKSIN